MNNAAAMTTASAILVVGRPLYGEGLDAQGLAEKFGLLAPAARNRGPQADCGQMHVPGGLSGTVVEWSRQSLGTMRGGSHERGVAFADLLADDDAPAGLEGYHCSMENTGYFGVEIRCVWDQWSVINVGDLDLGVSNEDRIRAMRICDAIPRRIIESGILMPFGTYLIGTAN